MTVNGEAIAAGPTNTYNLFAGQSLERLAALSDGLFAIVMTLLALDLHVPVSGAIHSEHDLWHALGALSPNLVTYFMTFLTLGIFWVGQQTQLNHFTQSDRNLTWIHIGYLSIAVIVLVQLNYVIAPRIPSLYRL